MSLLPLVPVLLLVLVVIWFFWPIVADPIARASSRHSLTEADQVAEDLFQTWSEQASATGALKPQAQG